MENRNQISKIVVQTLRRLNIPFMCGGILVGDCSACGGDTTNLLEFDEATNTITSTVNGVPSSVEITLNSSDLVTDSDLTIEGTVYLAGTSISMILWALASAGPTGYLRSVFSISVDTTAGNAPFRDYYYFASTSLTLKMPTALVNTNRYTVNNSGPGVVTVTDEFDIVITTISFTNNSIDLMSDGTNWRII